MKKKTVRILLLCVVLAFVLSGCGCRHEWADATCTEPSTCEKCGETDGDPRGHSWLDATCEEASICRRCGKTQGDPLEHTWIDATCEDPQTCEACGATEGEPLGHDWTVPDCENPRTCLTCGATVGEAGEHDWAEATCLAPMTCSICSATEGEPAGHVEGESEIVEADFVDATGLYESYCTVCGEAVSSETRVLPYLHSDGYFLFSAEEYAERLDDIMEAETDLYCELYINENMDNAISCDMWSLETGNDYYAYSFFYDGDYELIDTDSDKQFYFSEIWTLLDSVSADDTVDASNTVLVIMMALDPTLTWDQAYELGSLMVADGAVEYNGITYAIEYFNEAECQRLFTAIITG